MYVNSSALDMLVNGRQSVTDLGISGNRGTCKFLQKRKVKLNKK